LGSIATHNIDSISCHAAQGAKASKARAAILIVSATNKKVLALAPWVVWQHITLIPFVVMLPMEPRQVKQEMLYS
jgi:hypothetical protein